jgi:hypothetical protein
MTEYSGEFSWNPLINGDMVRSLRFETGLSYIRQASTGTLETRDHRVTTGIQFQNNGSITFTTRRTFDRLTEPFDIRPSIEIPAGDYSYRGHALSMSSDESRMISGNGRFEWGEFWNGERTGLGAGISLKPYYRWSVGLDYSRNHVTLPAGTFTTHLAAARFVYGFSPYAFFNAFVQYNADTDEVSSNIRFDWTHSPLSDLFIVYNDTHDTDRGELVERALTVKFTNLFSF